MDPALQAITTRIKDAAASQTPLRIRGGGTKDFYGQSLQGEILDTRAIKGIVSYESSELVVTVRAGTPLAELEALLAASGQVLPFEPPHFGAGATVGGMVASGLSGPARSSVGSVRDYVLGVTMVNGRGEELVFGGQVMKNVAGYDVSRLMAGSLGTLGLLIDVSLKVLPFSPAQSTLVFEMSEAQALDQLNRWAAQPLPVNASCWHEGALMVRLRGAQAAVAAAQKSMGGLVMDEQSDVLWAGLREQSSSFFNLKLGESMVRLSVPDTTAPLQFGPTLIEWGGAQRWVKLPPSEARSCQKIIDGLNGHVTLFRSEDKTPSAFSTLVPPLDRIHRELKKQFDPAGIFNRGRMYVDF
jgi:glycolate oxidase FAD binding subunit